MFKKKICISRIDKMGDMILTLPVIKSVKIQNPLLEIHVLASTYNAKVLNNIKYVDKVLFCVFFQNLKKRRHSFYFLDTVIIFFQN